MKVIFLDIDGVCNYFGEENKARAPSGCLGINDKLVDIIKYIVQKTDAVIVLTTTWKRQWSRIRELRTRDGQYLDSKFRYKNMPFYGMTEQTDGNLAHRGEGIHRWLDSHDVQSWVVIDDEEFIDFDDEIRQHLVLTDSLVGITMDDAEKAIDILTK